jgi:uncharacterized damage-inducible protein DinB
MEVKEYIQRQIANARRICDAAMDGTTDEQFNWTPPGTVNPIRASFMHLVGSEDLFIQVFFQGKPRVFETEKWGDKVGLAQLPGRSGNWDEAKHKTLPLGPAQAYQSAVRAATDAYLSRLTPQELDRMVDFSGTPRSVADVLATLVVHVTFHAGEIAAVKGVQGGKGLPF